MSSRVETPASCSRALPKIVSRAVLMTCLLLVGHVASAAAGDSIAAALRETKPLLDARWRIEEVEQSNLRDSAEAVTLRGRFGFETGKFSGTSLLAEGEVVWAIDDRYNSTLNGRADLPVIADPATHDLNRLQLTNTSLPGTTVVLGRQRIVLDDHRFVGDVGWRQNDQTFDAARLTNRSIENLTLDVT